MKLQGKWKEEDGKLLTGTTSLCFHKSEIKPQVLQGEVDTLVC
jgi:hypothetical protein